MEKKRCTKKRVIGFLCCALLPFLAMAISIEGLIGGNRFTLCFAITHIIIPLLWIGCLALCIFSNCSGFFKGILCVLIYFIFGGLFLVFFTFGGFIKVHDYLGVDAEKQYAQVQRDHDLLPALSEVGPATDVEYYDVLYATIIFDAESDYLVCRYTPEEYEKQKDLLNAKYTFQTEPIHTLDGSCDPAATVEGYHFRMLSEEAYEDILDYPKSLFFIGYSDQVNEIVYLAFDDIELDSISSLEDFLVQDCGWKYIR